MNNRPVQTRVSHGTRWFSWLLALFLLVYLLFVLSIERISWADVMAGLQPSASGLWALLVLVFRIVRHFIPLAVGWWFAYRASVQTVTRLYDLADEEEARLFLRRLQAPHIRQRGGLPLSDQNLEADRAQSVLLRVGGPGKVTVFDRDVAVTEDNGRFARVLGPGSHLLLPYERVHTVLDLRNQERQVQNVSLRTRDNIELTAVFSIVYRIRRTAEEPTKSRPYPYDEEAVRAAAYAYTVLEDGAVSTWKEKPISTTRSKLAEAVGKYRLDEIIHPPGRHDEPYRALQREVWRAARNDLSRFGIELVSVHIDQLRPPPEVEKQYIKYWQSHWASKSRLSEADGAATAVEEIEVARAEAEVAMIQAILEGIQRARRSGATSRTGEVIALRLVDGLERLAEQTRHARPLMPDMNKLRAELLRNSARADADQREGADEG